MNDQPVRGHEQRDANRHDQVVMQTFAMGRRTSKRRPVRLLALRGSSLQKQKKSRPACFSARNAASGNVNQLG
jgi:hypothetical protein